METHFALLHDSAAVEKTYGDRLNKALNVLANRRASAAPLVTREELRQAATVVSCKAVSPKKLSPWYALRPGCSSSQVMLGTNEPRSSKPKDSSSQNLEAEYDLVARRGREADDYVAGVGKDSPVELAARASSGPIKIKIKNSPVERAKSSAKAQGSRRKYVRPPRKSGLSKTTLASDVAPSPLSLEDVANKKADGWAYEVSHSGTKLVKSPTSGNFIDFMADEGRHDSDPAPGLGNVSQPQRSCPPAGTFLPRHPSISSINSRETSSIPISIPRYKLHNRRADPRAPRAPIARMAPMFASSEDSGSKSPADRGENIDSATPPAPQPIVTLQPVSAEEAQAMERLRQESTRHGRRSSSTALQGQDVLQLAQELRQATNAPESQAAADHEKRRLSQHLRQRREMARPVETPTPSYRGKVNVSRLTRQLREAAEDPTTYKEVSLDQAPSSSLASVDPNDDIDSDTIVVTPRFATRVMQRNAVNGADTEHRNHEAGIVDFVAQPQSVAPLDTLNNHRVSFNSSGDVDLETISASSSLAAATKQPSVVNVTDEENRPDESSEAQLAASRESPHTRGDPTSAAPGESTSLKRKKDPDSPRKDHKPATRGKKTARGGRRATAGRRTQGMVEQAQDSPLKTPRTPQKNVGVRGGLKPSEETSSNEKGQANKPMKRSRRSGAATQTPQRLRVLRGER